MIGVITLTVDRVTLRGKVGRLVKGLERKWKGAIWA